MEGCQLLDLGPVPLPLPVAIQFQQERQNVILIYGYGLVADSDFDGSAAVPNFDHGATSRNISAGQSAALAIASSRHARSEANPGGLGAKSFEF